MSFFNKEKDILIEDSSGENNEHYDGVGYKELYPEKRNSDWDHSRGCVRNLGARAFLQRIRETNRRIELLERRCKFREETGENTDDLKTQIEACREELKVVTSEIAEEISKLNNVAQEMVLVKRYIDLLTWDQIAEEMDIRVNTVLKFHGFGLHRMQKQLQRDGLVDEIEIDDYED